MKYFAYSSLHEATSGPYQTWREAVTALGVYKRDAKELGIEGKNNICLDIIRVDS